MRRRADLLEKMSRGSIVEAANGNRRQQTGPSVDPEVADLREVRDAGQ